MNILIADDNDKMRHLIRNMLMKNIRSIKKIYECKNGKEAIKTYSKFNPDWTLLDIKMNSFDGLSAAEKIKALNPNAKIVIVTNYNEASYRKRAKSISVDAYVLKENLKELISVLTGNQKTVIRNIRL